MALADGAFDARVVLNDLVSKGYIPFVKPTRIKPDGYGAKIRDRIFDKTIYRFRAVGEGLKRYFDYNQKYISEYRFLEL